MNDDVPENDTTTDGEPTDGEPTDGEPTDGEPTDEETTDEETTAKETTGGTGLGVAGSDVRRYATWGAFGVCALLAVIAAFQLYFSVDHLVAIWIADEYEPAFRAAFNLVVLLLAGYGAVALADRLNS